MLETIKLAIEQAADYSLSQFNKQQIINFKEGDELVTEVDKHCESLIKQTILEKYPNDQFWGEEGGKLQGSSENLWLVDPVDGSVNYSHGIKLFGISIAVVQKGEVVAGGVCNPITNELFTAEKGKGAFLNGKPIAVSKEPILAHSIVYATELYKSARFINALYDKVKNFRITSSSAYETCLVACGRTEAFIKVTTHPWGFAAANLIVEEAGGKVTNFDGSPWSIESTHLLSSNGVVHEEILAEFSLD